MKILNDYLFVIDPYNGGGLVFSSDGTRSHLSDWIKGEIYHREGIYYVLRDSDVYYSIDHLSDSWNIWMSGVSSLFGDGPSLYIDNFADLPSMELGVEVSHNGVGDMGVGDRENYTIDVRNLASASSFASEYRLDIILSDNQITGDADDLLIGSRVLQVPGLEPEAVHTILGEFEVPEEIRPGRFSLAVKLTPVLSSKEISLRNNVGFSVGQQVVIPGWTLDLSAEGDGLINQDLAARTYPHNARVSLTANAGKGALFTGWSGDGLGRFNQISVMMTGNKQVTANFSSRAVLQVHTRGNGTVGSLAAEGSYLLGEAASITAIPADGWVFKGWQGAATNNDVGADIVMDQSKQVTATFSQPLANWKAGYFSEAQLQDSQISSDLADPDGDQLSNLQEYYHGSDPLDRSSNGVIDVGLSGGYYVMIFTRNTGAGGTTFVSEGSRDMRNWDEPTFRERVLGEDSGVQTVESRISVAGEERGFLRFSYRR